MGGKHIFYLFNEAKHGPALDIFRKKAAGEQNFTLHPSRLHRNWEPLALRSDPGTPHSPKPAWAKGSAAVCADSGRVNRADEV